MYTFTWIAIASGHRTGFVTYLASTASDLHYTLAQLRASGVIRGIEVVYKP